MCHPRLVASADTRRTRACTGEAAALFVMATRPDTDMGSQIQRGHVRCAPVHAIADELVVHAGHLPRRLPRLRQRFMHEAADNDASRKGAAVLQEANEHHHHHHHHN